MASLCCDLEQETFIRPLGAQWLSGRVLGLRPRGRGFQPHRRHCVVSLSKTHLIPDITEKLFIGR